MNVIVVAAHPDDEVLGAGGAIATHIERGDKVRVVMLGEGIAARGLRDNKRQILKLKNDSKLANKKLGVEDIHFHSYPDNSFDSVPLLDIIKTVEKHVMEFKPEIVYTHHWGDMNIDHSITFKAVMTTCRPIKRIKKILCFEVLSSTEQNVQLENTAFLPNYYLNIERNIGKKIDAMKEYSTEIQKYPFPRSLEGIEILAKYRGLAIGCKAAEAFHIARELGE